MAADTEDPFAVLDALPPVDAGAGRTAGAVGGGWFGWLGYRLAARVERFPLDRLPARRPAGVPPRLLRQRAAPHPDGRWWFEALVTAARRAALERRQRTLADLLRRPRPAGGRP